MSGSVFGEFQTLFAEATDRKLMLDVGDDGKRRAAIEQLEHALKIGGQLPDPWPQACAYRLAHLLLREPVPDLKRAVHLLTLASQTEELGVYPLVYLMAVQCRLGMKADETYRRARDLLRRGGKPKAGSAAVQRPEFNLLELAACFANLRHAGDLDGLGGVDWLNAYRKSEAWALVTYGSTDPIVPRSKKDAFRALDALKKQEPEGVFFWLEDAEATLEAGGYRQTWPNKQFVEYLAILCVRDADDSQARRFRGSLDEVAPSHVGTRSNLDSFKTHLRQLLSGWTGKEPVLTKDRILLPTYGAVSLKHLFR